MKLRLILAAILVLALTASRLRAEAPPLSPEAADLVKRAGTTASDAERLETLRRLQALKDLPEPMRADLEKLATSVGRWNGRDLSYFRRQMGDFDYEVSEDSPLFPIVAFYRARMRVWVELEFRVPDSKAWREETARLFRTTAAAFPENRIAAMYLGTPIPARSIEAPADAPAWAVAQREGLERLADIVEWWVDHRQNETGLFGGALDDDVEMWRWWAPVLLAFDSPKIVESQRKLCEAVYADPLLKKGYWTAENLWDVEHTAEPAGDVIVPMLMVRPDDPVWQQRALRLADLMENLWMGRNERGFLQFKSVFFDADRVSDDPVQACDTAYHVRAVAPIMVMWQLTRDERLGRLLCAWMDTWADATARAERGKPAGVMPPAIHWPDGRVGGVGEDWKVPGCGKAGLYDWSGPALGWMQTIPLTLLMAHHLTGEERYLTPLKTMVENGHRRMVSQALTKHRLLTGDAQFDAALQDRPSAYLRFRLTGDETALTGALENNARALRWNFEAFTQEPRYTDRIIWIARWLPRQENGGRLNTNTLYESATGDPGSPDYYATMAVRWLTPPRDIAALVTESSSWRFAARLYHFGPEPRAMKAELRLLEPGRYACAGNGVPLPDLEVVGPRTMVEFTLPPGQEFLLEVLARGARKE